MTRQCLLRPMYLLLIAVVATAAGCAERDGATSTPATLTTGPWHADLSLPGGPARFSLEFSREGDRWGATVITGTDRIQVPLVTFSDARLSLQFPAFNNRIDAILVDGELKGSLTLVKRYGKTQVIPFNAKPGARPAPKKPASAAVDLSGRWSVTFTEADGSTYPAVGEFSQRGNRLFGTFLTETGDFRFLGGSMYGTTMRLSTFDGAHAFLFSADLTNAGTLIGEFWSGTSSYETWQAERNPDARLSDPAALTFLKPGYERFNFTFPDLDGNAVSLDDPRFRDKVVVVTLAGSWCPNCHDEAALMSELYARYHPQGVEVIALMYEHFEDVERAREQVQRFRDKFKIDYLTLLAGVSDKTLAAETLPALNHVLAFPTTIYIGRQGKVREIHTGFSGPGTGEHYLAQKKKITRLLDKLVAEPARPARSDGEAPAAD